MRTRRELPADRAVRLINNLTHTGDFAGQPFNLRPWQRRIIKSIFKTGPAGLRLFRTVLLMLPRKNGKTELAAAIAIYCLLFDGTSGGEIYCAATEREQAAKVFDAMVAMLRAEPDLLAEVEIVESQKRIVHRASNSFCKAISAEASSKHGYNASVIIYDELHAARDRALWEVLATSQGTRLQPLLIAISTAGYDRHSILWELYAHAQNVLKDPTLDPTFLPIIFEAPIDADWRDERIWKRANPALGDFRSLADMRIAAQRAAAIPAQQNAFRRLYLNQWTEQADKWISIETWDLCKADAPAIYRGRPCYLGLDLSSTSDLTAVIAVYPDPEGEGFDVRAALFCPKDRILERTARDRVNYAQWEREGFLIATPGNVVDYERVRQTINEWGEESEIREIGYDPWNATDLITRLTEQDGFTCVPVRQGFANLSAPTKAIEKAILSRALRHDGNPVMRWNLGNVALETDHAGNVKPSKKLSPEKIDGIAALVVAVDRMNRRGGPTVPQYQMLIYGAHT